MRMIAGVAGFALAGLLGMALCVPATFAQARSGYHRSAMYQYHSEQGHVPGATLTPAQRHRIAAIRRQARAEANRYHNNRRYSAAQRQQRAAQVWRNAHNRTMAELNPTQRRHFRTWYHNQSRVAGYRGRPASTQQYRGTRSQQPMRGRRMAGQRSTMRGGHRYNR